MGSPIVDPQQRDAFLETAESLGYTRREFGFVHRSAVEAAGNSTRQVDTVHIERALHRGEYEHTGGRRWLAEALKDLYSGKFGAPDGATTWIHAFLIPEGAFKGKWVADAYFKLKDGTRVEFSDSRLYDSEADALKAASGWLRNHLKANRENLA